MLRGKHFPVGTSASRLRNRGRSDFLNEGLPILTFQETISCCCDVPGRTCFYGPDPVKARMKCHDPRIQNSMVPTICAANFGGVREVIMEHLLLAYSSAWVLRGASVLIVCSLENFLTTTQLTFLPYLTPTQLCFTPRSHATRIDKLRLFKSIIPPKRINNGMSDY